MKYMLRSISTVFVCSSLFAVGGFGVHIGMDPYVIEGGTYSLNFGTSQVPDIATVTRSDTGYPKYIGGYLYIDMIPVVDIELGGGLGFTSYNYTYSSPLDATQKYLLPWTNLSTYFSIQKPFDVDFTIGKFFLGGGVSWNVSLPVVDEDFIRDQLSDPEELIGVTDATSAIGKLTTTTIAPYLEGGWRYKIPLYPLAFDAKARYSFAKDFFPDSNGFLTITFGSAIAL